MSRFSHESVLRQRPLARLGRNPAFWLVTYGAGPFSFGPSSSRPTYLGTAYGDTVKTFTPKPSDIEREWFVVDAEGLVLGRMATEVARILRGKHKPIFAPHADTGDHVIVINAEKVVLTGNKLTDKKVYRHSGYPGGLKTRAYGDLLNEKPADTVRKSITGMLPKNRLGAQMATKLKVYAGAEHPHTAQKPTELVLDKARAAG